MTMAARRRRAIKKRQDRKQLMDMGFSEDAVTAALIANRNDIEQAMNALLNMVSPGMTMQAMNALLTMDETAALQAAQGATGRQEVIRVTAPVGSSAGTLLRVVHKGQQYNMSVPAGVSPGAQFFMTVPAAGGAATAAATAEVLGGPVSL